MINFNKDSVFNLKPIDEQEVREDARGLMIDGEEIIMAFKTIRDQVIFTNKRILVVDVQGIGKRKSFATMPYSKVLFFAIQTPGIEIVPDCELYLAFANGFTATFEFKAKVDIGEIGKEISKYVLS